MSVALLWWWPRMILWGKLPELACKFKYAPDLVFMKEAVTGVIKTLLWVYIKRVRISWQSRILMVSKYTIEDVTDNVDTRYSLKFTYLIRWVISKPVRASLFPALRQSSKCLQGHQIWNGKSSSEDFRPLVDRHESRLCSKSWDLLQVANTLHWHCGRTNIKLNRSNVASASLHMRKTICSDHGE